MRTTRNRLATLALAAVALAAGARAATPSADAIASAKIHDLTATLRVVDANFDELKRIGGDFATSYRFKRMDLAYKSPNRTRLEARVLGTPVVLIFNGGTKLVNLPFRKQVKNIEKEPGQKRSLLDLGILARDFLATDYQPAYLRNDGPLQVYKLSQRNTDNRSHEVVWVNPKTSIIERRRSINGDNVFQKEIRYTNARQIRPGIWMATRVEVYNQFGKLGAVQAFEDIKINLGVNDNVFAVS